ncbi:MAG TPA: hypothetical protein VIL48_18500 [Acidimicrobiales bacterium]
MIDRRALRRERLHEVGEDRLPGLHSVAQHIFGASLQLNNAVLPRLDGEAAHEAAVAIDELEAALNELRAMALAQRAREQVGTFGPTARAADGG